MFISPRQRILVVADSTAIVPLSTPGSLPQTVLLKAKPLEVGIFDSRPQTVSPTGSSPGSTASASNSPSNSPVKEFFRLKHKIAEGSYGTVYKGELYNTQTGEGGQEIAVKIMTKDDADFTDESISSIQEIDILSRLHHPYLLNAERLEQVDLFQVKQGNMIQVVTGKEHPKVTIAILMPLGIADVENYMKNNSFTIDQIKTIGRQTASALQFLHQHNVLHLDVKAPNVIIMSLDPLEVRLCDLGLALYTDKNGNRYFKKELITYTYRPPEHFNGRYYGTKADVWSWGILMLNMLLNVPYIYQTRTGSLSNKIVRNYINTNLNDSERMKTLHSLLRNKYPDMNQRLNIVNFLNQVLAYNSQNRLSMDQIMAHPFMSGIGKPRVEGFNRYPMLPQIASTNIDSGTYAAMDYLIRLHHAAKTLASSYFISSDIFHRGLICMVPLTNSYNSQKHLCSNRNWTTPDITSLYALTCFWLSIKLNEITHYTPPNIIQMGGHICNEDALLEMERQIIVLMNGILYRRNLYTRADNEYQLLAAFEYSTNIYGYSSDAILNKKDLLDPPSLFVDNQIMTKDSCYLINKDIHVTEPPVFSKIYRKSQYYITMKKRNGLALIIYKHKFG